MQQEQHLRPVSTKAQMLTKIPFLLTGNEECNNPTGIFVHIKKCILLSDMILNKLEVIEQKRKF